MRVSRFILTLACITLASVEAFSTAANFSRPTTYSSAAAGANSVVAADLNGDGFPDLVVATNGGVTILLNNDDGTYTPLTTYSTAGQFSNALAVADVNGDGVPDIVVTNECLQTSDCSGVAVLIGNGDGTFKSAVGYASGGLETGAVAVGDVNGDQVPDLVLTSNCQIYTCAGGTLSLLIGNGDGTFQAPIMLSDAEGPVALADMNGDGVLDLVTSAGVMIGNGDGSFQPANSQVVAGALFILLVDLNNDQKVDVVSVIPTGIAVQLGNGDGTLQNAVKYASGGANPLSVAAADINGDNFLDLVVANECTSAPKGVCSITGNVGVLTGNGDGTFKAAVVFASGGKTTTSVSLADANQDGKIDVFVTNACASSSNCSLGSVAVLLNDYLATTSTRETTSQTPTILGQPVTFTATVTSTGGGSIVPDGSTITFTDGSTTLGTGTTVSGVATLTASFSKTGTHTVVATYAGDLFHSASHGSVAEVVNGFPTTVGLTSSANPANYGQTVTLTAAVSNTGGPTPTGTVTFKSGTTVLGTVTLSNGTATLNTTKLAVGTSNLTASYNGDASNAKSVSAALQETVNQAQVTMTLTSSTDFNVAAYGQNVTFTATFSSNGGLPTGSVTFSSNGTTLGTATITNGVATFSTTKLPAGTDTVTASYPGNVDYSSASASITMTVIT